LTLALEHSKEKTGRKFWILYAILICAGMWTHYFSAFCWIAHVVIIMVYFGGPKKIYKDKKLFKTLILTYGLAVLLYLPWIPSFFNQIKTVQNGFWIPEMSFETTADFISSALFFNKAQEVTSWGLIIGVSLIVVEFITFMKVYRETSIKNQSKLKGIFRKKSSFHQKVVSLFAKNNPVRQVYHP
jgi:uncharacterized membrane protein